MSKIKNGVLDQYGAGPFEQQQFETAGVERVKSFMKYCSFRRSKLRFWPKPKDKTMRDRPRQT